MKLKERGRERERKAVFPLHAICSAPITNRSKILFRVGPCIWEIIKHMKLSPELFLTHGNRQNIIFLSEYHIRKGWPILSTNTHARCVHFAQSRQEVKWPKPRLWPFSSPITHDKVNISCHVKLHTSELSWLNYVIFIQRPGNLAKLIVIILKLQFG